MQYEEFVERVQQRAELASFERAEAATRATLTTLGEYLTGGGGWASGWWLWPHRDLDQPSGRVVELAGLVGQVEPVALIDRLGAAREEVQDADVLLGQADLQGGRLGAARGGTCGYQRWPPLAGGVGWGRRTSR